MRRGIFVPLHVHAKEQGADLTHLEQPLKDLPRQRQSTKRKREVAQLARSPPSQAVLASLCLLISWCRWRMELCKQLCCLLCFVVMLQATNLL